MFAIHIVILEGEGPKKMDGGVLSIITLCYKKKSSVLRAILIDSSSWLPIKQSLMRRFFLFCQEGIFRPFEVSDSSYL